MSILIKFFEYNARAIFYDNDDCCIRKTTKKMELTNSSLIFNV